MSINRTEPAATINACKSQQDLKMRAKNQPTETSAATRDINTGTKVQISSLTQKIQLDGSMDVDTARLAKIKAAMDEGSLEFDYDKMAHSLVQNILLTDY